MNRIHPACEAWLERISARLDGELEPVEAALVESHLLSCASCRAIEAEFVAAERRAVSALEARVAEARLDGLAAGVLARIRPAETSGRPGRVLFVRFLSMVAAASIAAAGLIAALPPGVVSTPSPPGPPAAPELVGLAAPQASVTLLSLPNNDVVEDPALAPDLVQTVSEAERCFYLVLNAGDPGDLAGVRSDVASNGLLLRCRRLAGLSWSNPQTAEELGNVADNVAFIAQATPDLGMVQWQVTNNGALLSCDNLLVGSSAGANSYTAGNARWAWSANGSGWGSVSEAEATLFFSTYELLAAGDVAGAIAALDRIVTDHPGSAWADDALFRKGQIVENYLHDYTQAQSCYAALAEQHPDSNLSYGRLLNQTRVSLKDGSWNKESMTRNFRDVESQIERQVPANAAANKVYQRASSGMNFVDGNLDADPRPFELFVQAETALQQGDRARAHTLLDEILERHRSARIHEEALILKAEVLRLEGRMPEAVGIWDDVLRTYPEGAASRYAQQARRVVLERNESRERAVK